LISAGALPQIPLGELTALPQIPLRRPTSKGREGKERGEEGSGLEGPPFHVGIGPPEGLIRLAVHYLVKFKIQKMLMLLIQTASATNCINVSANTLRF